MGMFKRGFKAVNEEKERQEQQKNKGNGLFRFFLTKDKEEADITFLTEQPVNYYEHTLKTKVNGKDRYINIPCIGEGCKHCADGDRPSFKSAWLIIDHREYSYKDKDGNQQSGKDQLRLLVYGTKVASQLDRKSERYGLTDRLYTVVRLGTGTSTTYTFEHGDKYSLTEKEIRNVMPETIEKMYDGSIDSLYSIVENQIEMLVKEDLKEDEKQDVNEELISLDDEEQTPTNKTGRRLPPRRTNRTENSVKSIKKLLKSKK